jgi:hypothetical protein
MKETILDLGEGKRYRLVGTRINLSDGGSLPVESLVFRPPGDDGPTDIPVAWYTVAGDETERRFPDGAGWTREYKLMDDHGDA